jgi:hypothetical protein
LHVYWFSLQQNNVFLSNKPLGWKLLPFNFVGANVELSLNLENSVKMDSIGFSTETTHEHHLETIFEHFFHKF